MCGCVLAQSLKVQESYCLYDKSVGTTQNRSAF